MIPFKFNSFNISFDGYLRLTLPEEVQKEIKKTIKKIENGKVQIDDQRPYLAGHLQKEISFPIGKKLKYVVEALCEEYDSIFDVEKNSYHSNFISEFKNDGYDFKYVLRSLWINYGQKHDFNPIHSHSGVYSFVLWVKIPYKLEDEDKVYPCANGSNTGRFHFVTSNAIGKSTVSSHYIEYADWDLIFFPSSLCHTVYPFYTSDEERISIAGNLFYEPVKVKKK